MEDKNSMNIESRIADFLAGQCSEKERQELQTLLERDEEAARLMRRMSAVWAVASLPAFVGKEEENLSKIKRQVASEKPKAMRISGRRRRSAAAFFALFRAEGRRHFRRGPERPWNIRPFPAADQLRNPSGRGLALHPLAGRKETKARCAFPWETGEPGRERASSSPAERARRRRSAAFLPWWRSWPCTSGRPWPRPEPRECGPPSSSARRSAP